MHQVILGGSGAAVAQAEVVFGRAAFVAVALHHNNGVGKIGQQGLQRGGVLGQNALPVAANLALVVVEENVLEAIGHPLLEVTPAGGRTVAVRGGGAGASVTVTVTEAVTLPPGPETVNV